jgi:hypothetical protein
VAENFFALSNTTWIAQVGDIRAHFTFDTNVNSAISDFMRWLDQFSQTTLIKSRNHVICDLSEIDFRADTMPHLTGNDYAKVMERKLAQAFRSTPYRFGSVIGRESAGRRDNHVLLTAVTNPDALTPWLDALMSRGMPIVGVYGAPLLTEHGLSTQRHVPGESLLVLTHAVDESRMVRQTFVRDGRVRFSRTLRLQDESVDMTANRIAIDVTRTVQYLRSMRLLDESEPVRALQRFSRSSANDGMVLAIDHALDQQFSGAGQGEHEPIDGSVFDSFIEIIRAHKPDNHFAPADYTLLARLSTAKKTVLWVAAVACCATLAWLATVLIPLWNLHQSNAQLADQLQQLDQQRSELTNQLASNPRATLDRETLLLARRVLSPHHELDSLIAPLTQQLNRYPMLELRQVVWEPANSVSANVSVGDTSPVAEVTFSTTVVGAQEGLAVGSLGGSETLRATNQANRDSKDRPLFAKNFQVAQADLSLNTPVPQYRQALAYTEDFAKQLSASTGWRVTVVRRPLDDAVNKRLTAKLPRANEREALPVSLRIVRNAPTAEPRR